MPQPSTCQSEVQHLLERAVRDGAEGALQVAAYLEGERVVDAWAAPSGRTVDGDTLFPFFSTGKGIAATAVHRLVERGVLSWDDPVARHWPEFAAAGKGGITLRHVLSHTAGMAMMPARADEVPGLGWDAMCAYLAAAAPTHPPGTHRHYHAITYAWLVGETARRADGRPFDRIIREEVLQPLGIDTIFFGVTSEMRPRCVDAEEALPLPASSAAAPAAPPDPVAQRAIPAWVCPLTNWINRDDVRATCIPASTGFGNARGIARHYAALVGRGVDGVRLLRAETVSAATRWDPAVDGAIPGGGRYGLGYALQGPDDAPGAIFGHGGHGGSTGFADTRHNLAVGFVKSRLGGTLTGQVVETIRRGLGCQ